MNRSSTLILALSALIAADTLCAQTYSGVQILEAPARGEGAPNLLIGGQVAVDGDLAVVAERRMGALLRGYRRTGGVWQRAPELDRRQPTEYIDDLALSEDRLIYSAEIANTGGRRVSILRATPTGWVSEFGATASAGSGYGSSVAIAGPRAVIGAPGQLGTRGTVFTLTLDESNGSWDSGPQLNATPSQVGAGFGRTVAIVAGTVVAGAESETVDGLDDAGAAYVFELTQSTWTQVNRFTAPTPSANGRFGIEVAISGLNEGTPDRLLIASDENSAAGRVYAFRRGTTNWAATFTINPPTAQAAQDFGRAISMDGDMALIGARRFDLGGVDSGVIYGVDFNANFSAATFVQRGDPQPLAGALAGFAVAIDRDGPTTLVGAPLSDIDSNPDQGTVLMGIGSAAVPFPPLQRVFAVGQGQTNALFGRSLATHGDTLIIGAPGEAVGGTLGVGAVYVYRRQPAGNYQLEARLANPQGSLADFFGEAVAVHGDLALVGAPFIDTDGTDAGIVYVYRRTGTTWSIDRQLTDSCTSTQRSSFGRKIEFDGTRAMIGGICPPPAGGATADLGVVIVTRQLDGSWTYGLASAAARMSAGGWDQGLAVIGSYSSQGGPNNVDAGFVRSFAFNGTDWQFVGASDNGSTTPAPQGYGLDLSIDAGLLAVASYRPGVPVIVRRRNGESFLPETSLIPSGLGTSDPLQAVAVLGDRIAIGAQLHTVSVNQQGAVFLFERRLGTWEQTQRLVAALPQTQSYFGNRMRFAADGGLLVASPESSLRFASDGAVHLYAPPSDAMFGNGFE
jgi:hypothetical protein